MAGRIGPHLLSRLTSASSDTAWHSTDGFCGTTRTTLPAELKGLQYRWLRSRGACARAILTGDRV